MQDRSLNLVVGIATAGRREVLSETLDLLGRQTRLPDRILICPVSPSDVDPASVERFPTPVLIVDGAMGLPAQRNCILSASADADIVVFFDDDFFPNHEYLSEVERIFRDNPDVVAATGFLLADGAHGPGISTAEGLELIATSQDQPSNAQFTEVYGTYGCNMSFRMAPVRQNGVLFDENLALYGWQEDIDFSRRLAPYGRIIKSDEMRGVHLGNKRGRTSGVRLGYSQVANPIYLTRKGTFSRARAVRFITRNFVANVVRSLKPEPWVDRRGRLRGNLLAVGDIAVGRLSPLRILELD